VLLSYMNSYNGTRTHLSLHKDAPISRAVETVGRISLSPDSGRTAPPICPDLICGRHSVQVSVRGYCEDYSPEPVC
jgi:hypothetical protein